MNIMSRAGQEQVPAAPSKLPVDTELYKRQLPKINADEILPFFHLLYGNVTDPNAHIVFVSIDKAKEGKTQKARCIETCGVHDLDTSFKKKSILLYPKKNYYFTRGLHPNSSLWSKDDCIGLPFLSMDIDCHHNPVRRTAEQFQGICEQLAARVFGSACDLETYPIPNIVVFTGRGLQVYWCLDSVLSPSAFGKVSKLLKIWATDVAQYISDEPLFEGFSVDSVPISNPTSLFRLPLSYNQANGRQTTFSILHAEKYSFDELYLQADHSKLQKQNSQSLPENSASPYDEAYTQAVGQNRLFALTRLNAIRRGIRPGLRAKYFLIYYCACKMAGLCDVFALRRISKINASLPQPLREAELERALSTVRKEPYRFRTITIVEWLGITKEELEVLPFHPFLDDNSRKHLKRDFLRAQKKAARNEKIIRVYSESHSIPAAARAAGVAYNTAKSVLKKEGAISVKNEIAS